MELIKVEYIEESSKAIFFDVTVKFTSFWRGSRKETKRAFLEKWCNGCASNFKWSDNKGSSNFDSAIVAEMILKYEQRC